MGRATWETLEQPLPDRLNIVLSSTVESIPGVAVSGSLEEALAYCRDIGIRKIWVIGGAKVYKYALSSPFCSGIILSRINAHYGMCDSTFPDIDSSVYRRVDVDQSPSDTNEWTVEYYKQDPISEAVG